MKGQVNVVLALLLALIVALLAVANVDKVTIRYLIGETRLPLIIVIFGSAVLGALVVAMLGWVRLFSLQRQLKAALKENEALAARLAEHEQQPSSASLSGDETM
ncbi:lipopolysaccharide assembly LapA domain-containing protein [Geobacillus sp. C56-T2]|uniref:LapA family protein n=1 Tax=Geobacillus sp. C56-T2 TaxID=600773 RepID=UPI0011A21066|nr:LapA family protein [Geobacillus sp. C56-T2]NNV06598.1 LapA family protein [Geobacillus sp. MMMUD3]TWG31703.1 putative integral membrane protein [Geobacillus sp. C56-T2]